MGWFGDDHEHTKAYNSYQSAPKHEAHVSHELISSAASYEAAKAYENHVAQNGKPDSHAKAKEILAGFSGAAIDREFEKHGLNFLEKEKAKHQARKHAEASIDKHGGY